MGLRSIDKKEKKNLDGYQPTDTIDTRNFPNDINMVGYEYKFVRTVVVLDSLETEINLLGKDGWKIINANRDCIIMERKIG